MKIFLIGWFGAGNVGDEAILLSELLLMRKRINNAKFFILSFNPEQTRKLTCNIKEVEKIIGMRSKHRFLKSDFTGLFKAFKNSEAVIIGGGGIFQDIYNHYPIPFFTLMALVSKVFRKFLMLYAVGIGPIHTSAGKRLCRLAARSADIISVRDRESGDILRSIGVRKEIHVSADPVFMLEHLCKHRIEMLKAENKIKKQGPVFGICVQNLLSWSNENKTALANALDILAEKEKARLVFLPFGLYRDKWFSEDVSEPVDIRASKELAGMLKSECTILSDFSGPEEAMAFIGETDVMISMRLHGVIMSISMGVPVIALTYRHETKIRNIMERIGRAGDLFYVEDLDAERFLHRLENVFANTDELKQEVNEKAFSLRLEAEKSVKLLSGRLLYHPQ